MTEKLKLPPEMSPKAVARRLRAARENAGHRSAADAARELKLAYGTYSGHENGSRGMRFQEVTEYARAFNVSPQWILWGSDWFQKEHEIWGLIRDNGDVLYKGKNESLFHIDGEQVFQKVTLPLDFGGKHAQAYLVEGDYFSPKFENGDVLFFDGVYSFSVRERIGEWVIVDDGTATKIGDEFKFKFGQLQAGDSDDAYDLKVSMALTIKNVAKHFVMELYNIMPAQQIRRHLARPENQPDFQGYPKTRNWLGFK